MPNALRCRTIVDAVAEGEDHRLTLSSNLGEPVPLETKGHFLTLVRSDADRVEIQHGRQLGVTKSNSDLSAVRATHQLTLRRTSITDIEGVFR